MAPPIVDSDRSLEIGRHAARAQRIIRLRERNHAESSDPQRVDSHPGHGCRLCAKQRFVPDVWDLRRFDGGHQQRPVIRLCNAGRRNRLRHPIPHILGTGLLSGRARHSDRDLSGSVGPNVMSYNHINTFFTPGVRDKFVSFWRLSFYIGIGAGAASFGSYSTTVSGAVVSNSANRVTTWAVSVPSGMEFRAAAGWAYASSSGTYLRVPIWAGSPGTTIHWHRWVWRSIVSVGQAPCLRRPLRPPFGRPTRLRGRASLAEERAYEARAGRVPAPQRRK